MIIATCIIVLIIPMRLNLSVAFTYSFTVKGLACLTECKKWTGDRDYCWSSWSEWDYCTPGSSQAPQYFTSLKRGDAYQCESICGTFGYSYNWCWTDVLNSDWDYCSASSGKSSRQGYTCFTPCEKSNAEYYTCFAVSDKEEYSKDDYCSPAPYDIAFFETIETALIKSCGNCIFRDSCGTTRIRKRQKDWQIRKIGVENLVRRYERRFVNIYPIWDSHTQAVISYVQRPAPPVPGLADVNLTMAIRAVITPHHTAHVHNQGREYIPQRVDRTMVALENVTGDERGHLLAASLGGPTEPFNFAPQSRALNRRVNSHNFWYTMETSQRYFLNTNTASRIEWTLVIAYNLSESRRPTLLGLNIRQYDGSGNLICDSNDCIFSNDPAGGGPII